MASDDIDPEDEARAMEEIEIEGAAEGYLEIFRRYGVDYVFCSPGTEFVPFWEFLAKLRAQGKKPGYVNARHEGLALSMAKGYTMATGRPQAVLLHVLFGLLHGAMELKSIYTDNIPMLVIAGQARTHEEEVPGGTPGPHYLPFTEVGGTQRLVQPYVKWCDAPDTNLNMHYILARAFRVASSEPKGPVFLLLSRELMFEELRKMRMPSRIGPATSIQADPGALRKLAELLAEADNPVIYTRYLGRNPGAVGRLVELAELVLAPVFETPVYMNFPTDHPLHMGYDVSPHLGEADLILVVDGSSRPPWYPPSRIQSLSKAKIAFIDVDPAQLKYPYYGYQADLLIAADSSLALPTLVEALRPMISHRRAAEKIEERYERWKEEHSRQREDWREEALRARDAEPIDPRWLCHVINDVMDPSAIVVHETITHRTFVDRYVEKNRVEPGHRFEGGATTGLGLGLGVALGSKLASPGRTVIALEGDGSFNYNPVLACFGLAQEYHMPFLTVIFDNRSYAAMKSHQRHYPDGWSVRTDTYYGVYEEPKPDYPKLAEAFGGYGETVADPAEVKPALLRALDEVEEGRIALLDVILPKP